MTSVSDLAALGADPDRWVGAQVEHGAGDIACERGYVLHWLEATENANPLFWDAGVADELAGGELAPPSMLSVWSRPLVWQPDRGEPDRLLVLHHAMKEAFGLPHGIVASTESVFVAIVRPGDRLSRTETVRDVGEVRTTRLGTGRSWTIDVTYRNQRDEIVGIDAYEMFSYAREAS
jgi:acyl dehydratase